MKIAACIKWVPMIARLKFDPETKRIIREGVPSELNAYDQLAVQRAVELRDIHGGEITIITMGPPNARQGLIQCLAMGADKAIHINDRAFAGSDTLATARALSLCLARDQYDLIMFGYHSTDAETSQVGPEAAELLGLPQVTSVRSLDFSADGTKALVEREGEDGYEVIELSLPGVVTVVEGIAPEIFPDKASIQAAEEQKEIVEITAAELSNDTTVFGASGSPTWVEDIRFIESTREQVVLQDLSPEDAAKQIVGLIEQRGLMDPSKRHAGHEAKPANPTVRPPEGPSVWVMAEIGASGLRSVTYELLGAAQDVADSIKGHVAAVILGGPGSADHAAKLTHAGADVVLIAEDESLAPYLTEPHTQTLVHAIEANKPYAVLYASTVNGRDLAARVAARLQLGLTGDCVGLEVDAEGRLVQMKPAFGGNVVAPIYSKTQPYMATVRPGLLTPLAPDEAREAPVEALPVQPSADGGVRIIETHREENMDPGDLDEAWSIVGIGMGIGGAKSIADITHLLETLDAAVVCTRDVVDEGWMPRQRQVGLTGRSIAPDLYIAIGIRGDFNHTVGIQRAGTVVAINNNKRAAIFRQADIGVVDEWQRVVPALVAELQKTMVPEKK
ncbi:MAG: FAD-binding protein [Chloroflexi bacterium]|nr:FAD-binding protein [Chloroflexota bacterium]